MSSEHLLSAVSQFVEARLGLRFSPDRWRDLERCVGAAAKQLGYADAGSCMRWLVSSAPTQKQVEVLAAHLTVGETHFFRDKSAFDFLQETVLPELIRSRLQERRLRFWSAGCSTGEEPYSLAVSLHRLIPNLADWNITILATDINLGALERARAGVYGEWSFRGTPPWVRANYFRRVGDGRYEICSSIRQMVSFSHLNLAEDAYPSLVNNTNAVDLILCRNVLMYFSPERARSVALGLHRSLVEGGWLIVSPCELSQSLFAEFVPVNFPGGIFYRKKQRREAGGADTTGFCGIPEPEVRQPVFEAASCPTVTQEADPVATAFSRLSSQTEADLAIGPADSNDCPFIPDTTQHRDAQTSYEDARRFYEQGRYAEARTSLEQLTSMQCGGARCLALLARVCANEGRLSEALAWSDRAIAQDKMQAGYHYLRAVILEEQGEEDEAAASLRRALYLDQDFVLAHFALGNLARRLGNSREWRRHRNAALSALCAYRPTDALPESDGITAGRLEEILRRREVFA